MHLPCQVKLFDVQPALAYWFTLLWLCSEVYAAREKVGVYIPKERYYQEESERKVFSFLPSFPWWFCFHLCPILCFCKVLLTIYSFYKLPNHLPVAFGKCRSGLLNLLKIHFRIYYFFCPFSWFWLLFMLYLYIGHGWTDWANGGYNRKQPKGLFVFGILYIWYSWLASLLCDI